MKKGNAHTLHILDSSTACGRFKCALKEKGLNLQCNSYPSYVDLYRLSP